MVSPVFELRKLNEDVLLAVPLEVGEEAYREKPNCNQKKKEAAGVFEDHLTKQLYVFPKERKNAPYSIRIRGFACNKLKQISIPCFRV